VNPRYTSLIMLDCPNKLPISLSFFLLSFAPSHCSNARYNSVYFQISSTMFILPLLAILATKAIANPLDRASEAYSPTPRSNQFAACEAATNCETCTESNGLFQSLPEQECGTTDYAHRMTKGDTTYAHTQITLGD